MGVCRGAGPPHRLCMQRYALNSPVGEDRPRRALVYVVRAAFAASEFGAKRRMSEHRGERRVHDKAEDEI